MTHCIMAQYNTLRHECQITTWAWHQGKDVFHGPVPILRGHAFGAGGICRRVAHLQAAQEKGRTSSPPQGFRTHELACYPLEGQEEVGVYLKAGLLD